MVAQTQFDPQNPNALFSPDQWLNQFSNFNNAALPWPSSYSGMPTDAMGKPIQPPPGTTLNSSPQAQQPAAPAAQQTYGLQPSDLQGSSALNPSGNQAFGMANWGGMMSPQAQQAYANQQFSPVGAPRGTTYANGGQNAGAAPAAAPSPALNSWQNTMAMLANPGKVTTPGATVPATASTQPGPGALQAFLQNYKPTQSGPGAGFQNSFAGTLKGMGY